MDTELHRVEGTMVKCENYSQHRTKDKGGSFISRFLSIDKMSRDIKNEPIFSAKVESVTILVTKSANFMRCRAVCFRCVCFCR